MYLSLHFILYQIFLINSFSWYFCGPECLDYTTVGPDHCYDGYKEEDNRNKGPVSHTWRFVKMRFPIPRVYTPIGVVTPSFHVVLPVSFVYSPVYEQRGRDSDRDDPNGYDYRLGFSFYDVRFHSKHYSEESVTRHQSQGQNTGH